MLGSALIANVEKMVKVMHRLELEDLEAYFTSVAKVNGASACDKKFPRAFETGDVSWMARVRLLREGGGVRYFPHLLHTCSAKCKLHIEVHALGKEHIRC